MDSGAAVLFSPFARLCLAADICQFEKMRENLADVTEKELEAKQSMETWSCLVAHGGR